MAVAMAMQNTMTAYGVLPKRRKLASIGMVGAAASSADVAVPCSAVTSMPGLASSNANQQVTRKEMAEVRARKRELAARKALATILSSMSRTLAKISRMQRRATIENFSLALRRALIQTREMEHCTGSAFPHVPSDYVANCDVRNVMDIMHKGAANRKIDFCSHCALVPGTGTGARQAASAQFPQLHWHTDGEKESACPPCIPTRNIWAVRTAIGTSYRLRIMSGRLIFTTQSLPSFKVAYCALQVLRQSAASASTDGGSTEDRLQAMAEAGEAAALGLTFQATLDGRRWFGRRLAFIRSVAVRTITEALTLRREALTAEGNGYQAVCDMWRQWAAPQGGRRLRGPRRRQIMQSKVAVAPAPGTWLAGSKGKGANDQKRLSTSAADHTADAGSLPVSDVALGNQLNRLAVRAESLLSRNVRVLRRNMASTRLAFKPGQEPIYGGRHRVSGQG